MPRRTHRDERRPQHAKGLKRPRGWHRRYDSRAVARAAKWLPRSQEAG